MTILRHPDFCIKLEWLKDELRAFEVVEVELEKFFVHAEENTQLGKKMTVKVVCKRSIMNMYFNSKGELHI